MQSVLKRHVDFAYRASDIRPGSYRIYLYRVNNSSLLMLAELVMVYCDDTKLA